ncbi:MAG: hypothetical protein GTO53_11205 [Planctomycetales bacterium]|nr:hypothetical protein [Planctomycetales bacterium]NIM09683.1 hypothetical protein [Planctomycetales bacterium]NIN78267.1 hypothetical protein [Planctomycetales bacterium]NIO35458.1 hypothetical protein [Planctomycetales bacterium]NIO47202.1 hypothetical protein [Planctomycetales bacterium]
MTEPKISLRLIGDSRTYRPGESLSGEFFVDAADPLDVRAAELSVLWYTEGKGDEDMAVHFFQRIGNDNGQFVDFRRSQQFKTELPNSPLSYDGSLVKIHWCVRLRIFLPRGREVVAEQPFQLGSVPRIRSPLKIPIPHTLPAQPSIKETT